MIKWLLSLKSARSAKIMALNSLSSNQVIYKIEFVWFDVSWHTIESDGFTLQEAQDKFTKALADMHII